MAILPIILLGASSLVAQRKGLSVLPRSLRVINESPKGIVVRVLSNEGASTFRVPSNSEHTYRWHRGVLNVQRIFVRPDSDSLIGRGSEDEIVIPAAKQGTVLPNIRLIYRGLGDYDFTTSIIRSWKGRKKPLSQETREPVSVHQELIYGE